MKEFVRRLPFVGRLAASVYRRSIRPPRPFAGSEAYWTARYASGGNSGAGSYDQLAEFKAEFINGFVTEKNIETIIEYGCGDGNQLELATYPRYVGFDVSENAISRCRELFANDRGKRFSLLRDYADDRAQLTLSLDVLYHLVEDHVFEDYVKRLFDSSQGYVVVYSSDTDVQKPGQASHVKHRNFTEWVRKNRSEWKLQRHVPNRFPIVDDETSGSFADFYVYERCSFRTTPERF